MFCLFVCMLQVKNETHPSKESSSKDVASTHKENKQKLPTPDPLKHRRRSNPQSKKVLKHEEKEESDDECGVDDDEYLFPPVKQQKKLDGRGGGKVEAVAVHNGGSTVDEDEDDIDAAILTSLAQCCNKGTKESTSVDDRDDALRHPAKCQSKMAVPSLAKITRSMSVPEVSARLRSVNIDESVVQRLASECVDGEALHNFIAEDFEHFGIKYGPMVKIRSLL